MSASPFLDLVENENVATIVRAIETSIRQSFEHDRQRSAIVLLSVQKPAQAEVKRRTEMCIHIFKVLRGDMKWSIGRIVDHMPLYLRKELDGESWQPSAHTHWLNQS